MDTFYQYPSLFSFSLVNSFDYPYLLLLSLVAYTCTLVLFIQAAHLFRAFLFTRQAIWRYLYLLIPLTASIWAFILGLNIGQVYDADLYSSNILGMHMTYMYYQLLLSQYIRIVYNCDILVFLTLQVTIVVLVAGAKTISRFQPARVPSWTPPEYSMYQPYRYSR